MKIKDLPKEIKELALKRQVEQGNEPNEDLDLGMRKEEGNFNWKKTPEEFGFWYDINHFDFEPFYDRYLQNADNSRDEFAIGFAEWVLRKYDGIKSTKELLQIYKKELTINL